MYKAESILIKSNVVIADDRDAQRIYDSGKFGELKDSKLYLSLFEGLYLAEKGAIVIRDYRRNKLDFKSLVIKAVRMDKRFWTKYLVYKDIRSMGYITKTALKYGADFRVYNKGKYLDEEHAPWLLFAVSEAEQFDWRQFAAMNRVSHSVRKKLMIGVVDDEGDATYYEVQWWRP